MKVELIDHMGSDLTVVNAARVSMDRESEWEYWAEESNGNWMQVDKRAFCFAEDMGLGTELRLANKDARLIAYLAKHNHWSPFAHTSIQFRITAPIFVARQLAKHQVGLAWNEVSRRYVDTNPIFHSPQLWRARAENVKQGSSDEGIADQKKAHDAYSDAIEAAVIAYETLLAEGVCPEQARMVLPQAMLTSWYWTGSLYAFARVCKLRLDPHAQRETAVIAQGIAEHCARLFPVSWAALMGGTDGN